MRCPRERMVDGVTTADYTVPNVDKLVPEEKKAVARNHTAHRGPTSLTLNICHCLNSKYPP